MLVTPCRFDGVAAGIPEQLRVVVRVRVDEARRDDETRRVDDLGRVLVDRADGNDAPVADADVGAPRRRARAVDEQAAADQRVEHPDPPEQK